MKSLRRFFNLVKGLTRELSDEAAYRRYLLVNGRAPSPREWRTFTDQRYAQKYQNAKCC